MSKSKIQTAIRILKKRGIKQLSAQTIAYITNKDTVEIEKNLKFNKIREVNKYKQNINGQYNHNPKISILIQSFNNKSNIEHIVNRLSKEYEHEIIVLEDGSIDGSLERWDENLTRRNDFLIRSNDLHEIRAYTRGVQMSQGKYICLLQDDDKYPDSHHWLSRATNLFDSFPDLGAIGGWGPGGLGWGFGSEHNQLSYDGRIPPMSEWEYSENDMVFPKANGECIDTVDPTTAIPLIFVPRTAVGPLIIDREALDDVGGFNFEFSQPGEPGMQHDTDLGLRLWKNGYKFGYSNMGFYENNTTGGTGLYQREARHENNKKNWELCRRKHEDDFENIERMICEANQDLVAVESEEAKPLIDVN